MTQEVDSQKDKYGQSVNLGALKSKAKLAIRWTEYGLGSSTVNSDMNEKNFHKDSVSNDGQKQVWIYVSSDFLNNAKVFNWVINGDETFLFSTQNGVSLWCNG